MRFQISLTLKAPGLCQASSNNEKKITLKDSYIKERYIKTKKTT